MPAPKLTLVPSSSHLSSVSYSATVIRCVASLLDLEKRKIETPRGGAWHPQLVKRIVPETRYCT
jgi:hypothetical protein